MSVSTKINKQGFIEQVYTGKHTKASIESGQLQLNEVIIKLLNKNQPVHILVDVSRLGKSTVGARLASIRGFNMIPSQKAAIYGANSINRGLINAIIKAGGRGNDVKMFNTRSEATNWLKKKTR